MFHQQPFQQHLQQYGHQQIAQHGTTGASIPTPIHQGHATSAIQTPAVVGTHVAIAPHKSGTPVAVPTPITPIKPPAVIKPPVLSHPVTVVPSTKLPVPVVEKPTVAFVQPNVLPVLRPPSTSPTHAHAMHQLALTSGHLDLGKPHIPMAKPDMPIPIKPRPYGSIPTSSPFHLPEKPPEGHTQLAADIEEHLKKRPPIHEPDEVIAEDLSIKDAKER
jgi:hypothetical protein